MKSIAQVTVNLSFAAIATGQNWEFKADHQDTDTIEEKKSQQKPQHLEDIYYDGKEGDILLKIW